MAAAGPSWAADGTNNPSAAPTSSGDADDDKKKQQTNKPKDSKLRQQKLPAWQPILTAGTVIPSFFIVGLIFLPIGIGLYVSANNIDEFVIDYTTHCVDSSTQGLGPCHQYVTNKSIPFPKKTCKCNKQAFFEAKEEIKGDVFFYYGLKNFFQNHRRYVKSRSDVQLLGKVEDTTDCDPYTEREYSNKSKVPYSPCGAIANSLFNDSFTVYRKGESGAYEVVPLTWDGVAWPTDYSHKFKNPELKEGETLADGFKGTTQPFSWSKAPWELDPDNPENNGLQNADFIVWMRTAALPSFRKLYRRLNRTDAYKNGLPKGTYVVDITYNFPVDNFGGAKMFIASTANWVGGRNDFLGVAYMVVGSLCIVLGFLFLFIHLKFGKSLTEMSNLANPAGRA